MSIAGNLNNEHALYELAHCLDLLGQLESHLGFYNKLIDRDPYSHHAWYNLGIAYSKLERYEEAVQAYEYATLVKEDFASAFFNLGQFVHEPGRL